MDSQKLAQADIKNARLDEKVSEFKSLEVAAEASRNAKKIFFSMLLACVYSWLTVGSTTDVALLTNSSSSNLPIIQTGVPIATFYLAAPFLLLILYIYLHLYLRRLWQALASLPAIFEDGKPLDERTYPWILNGLVRRHFKKLKGEYNEIIKAENADTIEMIIKEIIPWLRYRVMPARPIASQFEEWVSILLAWWVVPFTLGWFWLRYLTRHDWDGTIMQVVLIVVTVLFGIIFYRVHAKTLAGAMFKKNNALEYVRWILLALLTLALIICSKGGIDDHDWAVKLQDKFGYDISANFREQDVSIKPDNYWLIDSTMRNDGVKGARLAEADLRYAEAEGAFLVNADMRGANMEGILLIEANMKGANLDPLVKGGLTVSTNLANSHLSGANFANARLEEVNFTGGAINQAYFDGVKLYKANFSNSYLYAASFGDAELVETDFSGANLTAVMGLTQDQLNDAIGDSGTILPPGLSIPIK
jgi:hypothetical protein